MEDKKVRVKTTGGVSLITVVQIVFIILKLTNLIDWPWTTVLIPLWINLGLIVVLLICYAITNFIYRS